MVKFLRHFPAHELIFFRSVISLFATAAILRYKKLNLLGNDRRWLLVRGTAGILALLLFFITLQNMPFANAVAIQYLSPTFTALFGVFLLKERVSWIQWICLSVALSGAFVIKGFEENTDWLMIFLGIASAAFAGLAYNAVRRLRDSEHPLQVVFYFPLIATPVMGLWCLFEWTTPIGTEWILLVVLGIFTQIAQYYMTLGLHADKAAKVTPFKYFGALLAITFGYTFFDEQLSVFNYLGISLIVFGVIFNTIFSRSATKPIVDEKTAEA